MPETDHLLMSGYRVEIAVDFYCTLDYNKVVKRLLRYRKGRHHSGYRGSGAGQGGEETEEVHAGDKGEQGCI